MTLTARRSSWLGLPTCDRIRRKPELSGFRDYGGKRHIRVLYPDGAGEEYAVCLSNEA